MMDGWMELLWDFHVVLCRNLFDLTEATWHVLLSECISCMVSLCGRYDESRGVWQVTLQGPWSSYEIRFVACTHTGGMK